MGILTGDYGLGESGTSASGSRSRCPSPRNGPAAIRPAEPGEAPVLDRLASLQRHFRDALCHGTRRAQRYVPVIEPSGQDGAAVAHAPVIGMCRTARAMT